MDPKRKRQPKAALIQENMKTLISSYYVDTIVIAPPSSKLSNGAVV